MYTIPPPVLLFHHSHHLYAYDKNFSFNSVTSFPSCKTFCNKFLSGWPQSANVINPNTSKTTLYFSVSTYFILSLSQHILLHFFEHVTGLLRFLPARRYASAGNSDRNVSVRLSVRPSVCHAPVLCQNA